jgi:hypothetical protein
MDISASYHMTFLNELFTSFKEWKGNMKLGDDKESNVKGSDYIQIKMYYEIVRTLDTWYVPDL